MFLSSILSVFIVYIPYDFRTNKTTNMPGCYNKTDAASNVGDYEGSLARLTEMTYLLQQHVSLLTSATTQHVGVLADVLTSCELLIICRGVTRLM